MQPVLLYPGIGASHHTGNPTYAAVDNIVVKRGVGGPKTSAEHVIDVLVGKPMDTGVDNLRDLNRHVAVFKPADGLDNNLIGAFFGFVIIKLNVHGAFYMTARVRGNQLGTITVRNFSQALFDTLYIHTHGVNRTGNQNRFGGHKVAGMGYAVTHKHLQTRAAHSHQVDSFGTGVFGGLDQGWFPNRFY